MVLLKIFSKLKTATSLFIEPYIKMYRNKDFKRLVTYTRFYEKEAIKDRIILYENDCGKSMSGNPYSMFEQLIDNKKYRDYLHVWVVDKPNKAIAQKYKEYSNVKFVELHSKKYLKYLTSAKYLINNNFFATYFQKKRGQVYINTLDNFLTDIYPNEYINNPHSSFRNIQRNLFHTDFILANDNRTVDLITEKFDLRGIYEGKFVTGYQNLIDVVFNRKNSKNIYQVKDKKKNILMYCGGFLNNGITTSAINLLNNLNYNKYNVMVVEKENLNESRNENFNKLHHNVKKYNRVGNMNVKLTEFYRHNYTFRKGLRKNIFYKLLPKKLYEREMSRLFGNIKFDIVIDFSGYVPFWTTMFAMSGCNRKIIYQHNDMLAESKKIINNKFKHRLKMDIIFPLYKNFDKIVSVSKSLMELNAKNLSEFLPPEKISYVNNYIDAKKILNQSQIINSNRGMLKENKKLWENLPTINSNFINFVNMGRLSPEKNQKKLIIAFSEIAKKYKNVRLYILGEGVLEQELKEKVKELNLQGKVYFTGQLSNPFYFIKKCDCFVLSSQHEGQPMSLLEMMVLGKPIIATDIPGSRDVLEGGYGLLVENSKNGLVKGMESFINKEVPQRNFDYIKYNQNALNLFYKEVCGETLNTKTISVSS